MIVENNEKSFIGKKIEEVKNMPNIKYRVMMEDGQVFFGTCDYVPTRYNFTVENGIIIGESMG